MTSSPHGPCSTRAQRSEMNGSICNNYKYNGSSEFDIGTHHPEALVGEQYHQARSSTSIVTGAQVLAINTRDIAGPGNNGEGEKDPSLNASNSSNLPFLQQEAGTNILPFLVEMRKTVLQNSDKLFATWHGNNGEITDQYTFQQLWEEAGSIAHHLCIERGLNKGDRVVLCYNFGLSFFASFLGCIRGGITAVLVYPPHPPLVKSLNKMNKVIEDCEAKLILTDSDILLLKKVDTLNLRSKSRHLWPQDIGFKDTTKTAFKERNYDLFSIFTKYFTKRDHNKPLAYDNDLILQEDVAFFQYTSGSTGDPKGVMVTYEALANNVKLFHASLANAYKNKGGIPKKFKGCSWLPQYHDLGLIAGNILPFTMGWTMCMMSPVSFIKNPLLWVDIMSRERVSLGVAPNFAIRLVARKFLEAKGKATRKGLIPPDLDLSCVTTITACAEPIQSDTKKLFDEAFAEYGLCDNWFVAGYGLAENVVLATSVEGLHLSIPREEDLSSLVAVGCREAFSATQQVKIVCPISLKEVPDNVTGEIWIAGPSVAAGYFKKTKLTQETFCAQLADSQESFGVKYLRTGDLGFFQDGYLFICGRQKDLIIVNGANYYPQDIESAVQNASNKVRPGCIAAFSSDDKGVTNGDLEVVFEIRSANLGDVQQVVEIIHLEIQQKIGLAPSRIIAIKERTIPKTTSGKIQRRATREALHSDKLQVIFDTASKDDNTHAYIEDPEKDAFDNIVAKYFGRNFDSEQTWEDMGMSSMTSVEFRDSISDKHAITLSPDCFEKYPTPSSLKSFTLSHTGTPLERRLPHLSSINSVKLSWFVMGTMQAIGVILLLLLFAFSIVPALYMGKWLARNELTSLIFQVGDGRWFRWMWAPLVVPTWMCSYSLSVIFVKWLVMGKYKEGLMDVPSFAYLRWWFVDRAIGLWEQWIGHYVKNTALITLMYYLMGAKISPSAKIDAFIREFDLVEIAKGACVEHPIHCRKFGTWEIGQSGPVIRFRSIQVGENSVLQGMASPGASIGNGACVNKQSVLEEGAQVPTRSVVKGNPAFLTQAKASPRNPQEEHCWWMLGLLKILWLGFELYHFVAALLVGQILLNGRLPSAWHYTPLLYWFLLLPVVSILTVASSILLKWILIGKRTPGSLSSNSLWRVAADWAADYHYGIAMSLPLVTVLFNSRIWNIVLMMYGMDIDLHSQVYLDDSFTPSNVDLIQIRKSVISTVTFDVKRGDSYHRTVVSECNIGWGARVGAGVELQRVVVSPMTHVTESIVQEEPDHRYNKYYSNWKLCRHEMEVGIWYLVVIAMIFASFIPAFEIWMSVFQPYSVWKAVPVLAFDAAIQTLSWVVLVVIVQRLSMGLSSSTNRQMPWRTPLYKVYLATNLAFHLWSLQGILHGTPMYNWFVRLWGIQVDGQALLFPFKIYDGPYILIKDKTIVDGASLNGHYAVYDKVTLGPCHVSGVLHEGTFAMANSVVSSQESGPWRAIIASSSSSSSSSANNATIDDTVQIVIGDAEDDILDHSGLSIIDGTTAKREEEVEDVELAMP